MTERIGFIGLGRMGGPMARRLQAQGHALALCDVNPAATAAFAGMDDVLVCASPAEVGQQVETVLLSLPSPAALHAVLTGPDGLLLSGYRGTVIDLSTSGVAATHAVAAISAHAGAGYLDAPVSGGVPGAEAGTLAVMVAGDAVLFEAHRPLLSVIGKNVFYVGAEPGQGQAMKLVNNMLSATAMAATAEAMAVATKAGIDPALALAVINAGSGQNTATRDKFPKDVITGAFAYGFQTALMLKDVKLYEDLADAVAVPPLISPAVAAAWRLAVAQGHANDDFTAIARVVERLAGVEIRSERATG